MTDPPCARCNHPAVCHETNYVERGPCWKCHTCPGYVVPAPSTLLLLDAEADATIQKALESDIGRWTDPCGCVWTRHPAAIRPCPAHREQ